MILEIDIAIGIVSSFFVLPDIVWGLQNNYFAGNCSYQLLHNDSILSKDRPQIIKISPLFACAFIRMLEEYKFLSVRMWIVLIDILLVLV